MVFYITNQSLLTSLRIYVVTIIGIDNVHEDSALKQGVFYNVTMS